MIRPRTVPAGFWYVLSDEASTKLARRRMVCWLWLPVILAMATVGAGHFVTAECHVKIWYYDKQDADQKPIWVDTETETDRLFGFNLHFRGPFFTTPRSWVRVVERRPVSFSLSMPTEIDPMFIFWGGGPLLLVLFGYLPARMTAVARARHRARRQGHANLADAVRAAWSVMSVPLGMAVWAWLLAAWSYGISELTGAVAEAAWYLVVGAAGWWVLVSLVGYGILVRLDRPRIVVGNRIGFWLIAVILSVGGPIAVAGGLLWMLQ